VLDSTIHRARDAGPYYGRCRCGKVATLCPVARLYPFCRDVGVREHPREIHVRNHGEPLRIEGIRCVRVQQANYPHLAVIGGNQQ
jgi:hypothetical protein